MARSRTVGNLIDSAQDAWDAALADFQEKARELDAAENALYDAYPLAQNDPDDEAEWQRLFARVNALKSTFDSIREGLATVTGWWDSFTSSIPGLGGYKKMGAAQLLVPVSIGALTASAAGVVALTAAITGFVTYLNSKNDHLSGLDADVETMREAGASESQITGYINSRIQSAIKAAAETSGYSISSDLVKIAALTVAGILAVLVLPRLLERKP